MGSGTKVGGQKRPIRVYAKYWDPCWSLKIRSPTVLIRSAHWHHIYMHRLPVYELGGYHLANIFFNELVHWYQVCKVLRYGINGSLCLSDDVAGPSTKARCHGFLENSLKIQNGS